MARGASTPGIHKVEGQGSSQQWTTGLQGSTGQAWKMTTDSLFQWKLEVLSCQDSMSGVCVSVQVCQFTGHRSKVTRLVSETPRIEVKLSRTVVQPLKAVDKMYDKYCDDVCLMMFYCIYYNINCGLLTQASDLRTVTAYCTVSIQINHRPPSWLR